MGRPRKRKTLPGDAPEMSVRISWLLDNVWHGNAASMARDLKVSHPALSRVLAGEQMPSSRMLEALAKQPDLNLRWLLAGEGEPLSERGLGAGGGHFLPVAKSLLPAPPQDCPERLTFMTFPVAAAFRSATAYWYRVDHRQGVTRQKHPGLAAGELVLVETAPSWTKRPDALGGRLVVLRASGCPVELIIAAISHDADNFEDDVIFDVNTFGMADAKTLNCSVDAATAASSTARGKGKKAPEFVLGDVVGVCLQATRLLGD